jgi:hypothetical protein
MSVKRLSIPAALLTAAIPALLAAGCASSPDIRLDRNPTADLHSYRTFAFFEPVTTDQSLYTTIISGRLKKATRDELERRNYVYDEKNPDLRVNFSLNVMDRQELRAMPAPGLLGARFGDLDTINYRQGTLSVDVVDAHKRELVWQGVAEGRVSRKSVENPGPAVDKVVGEMFTGFPLNTNDGQLVSTSLAPIRISVSAQEVSYE